MQEYRENGVRLGWLIDPKMQQVEIYRSQAVEVLQSPTTLSGEDVLPGFVLDLRDIFKNLLAVNYSELSLNINHYIYSANVS